MANRSRNFRKSFPRHDGLAIRPCTSGIGGLAANRMARCRQRGSHRVLSKDGRPNFVFAFHDNEEIGPKCSLASHVILAYDTRIYSALNEWRLPSLKKLGGTAFRTEASNHRKSLPGRAHPADDTAVPGVTVAIGHCDTFGPAAPASPASAVAVTLADRQRGASVPDPLYNRTVRMSASRERFPFRAPA